MQRKALRVAGTIFLLMSLAQLTRFIFKVTVMANNIVIPVWLSAVAFIVLLPLSLWMFRSSR